MSRSRNQRMNRYDNIGWKSDKKPGNLNSNRIVDKIFAKNRKAVVVVLSVVVIVAVSVTAIELWDYHYNTGRTYGNGGNTSSLPKEIGDFSRVSSHIIVMGGKIPIFFFGSMACPYCAEESWSIYVSLKVFGGNWNALQYIYSNSSDIYPNTPGLSFANSSFSDSRITFYGYEMSNRNWLPYQTLNASDDALFNQYDPNNNIPFILIGGMYLHIGDSFPPSTLTNCTGNTIMKWLDNGVNNTITEHIVNESNVILAVIHTMENSYSAVSNSSHHTNSSIFLTPLTAALFSSFKINDHTFNCWNALTENRGFPKTLPKPFFMTT